MPKHYQSSVLVHAPAERIWRVLSDVEQWQQWTASITRIEALSGDTFAPGARFRILQPRLKPAIWTITELQPGRRFTWESKQPGIRVVGDHLIETQPQGCKLSLSVTFAGPLGGLVGWLGGKLTQRYIAMEAEGLKRRVEGRDLGGQLDS